LIPQKPDGTSLQYWKDYFYGLGFALLNSAMRITMTTNDDIGEALLIDTTHDEHISAICIFDRYVGGLGFADKAFDCLPDIVDNAVKMVNGCACKDGCPACVGDYKLDKNVVLWGLKNLFETIAPPRNLKVPEIAPIIYYEKKFDLYDLPDKWKDFTSFILTTGEYMSEFLASIKTAAVERNTLILAVSSDFYKSWVLEESNYAKLKNMIEHYVRVPKTFKIECEVVQESDTIVNKKVAKRLDDLKK
jgi:DEAD/DEAH box helicase domain-containing protein